MQTQEDKQDQWRTLSSLRDMELQKFAVRNSRLDFGFRHLFSTTFCLDLFLSWPFSVEPFLSTRFSQIIANLKTTQLIKKLGGQGIAETSAMFKNRVSATKKWGIVVWHKTIEDHKH